MPNIFRKPLYRKFGNLHGVKELNINDSGSLIEEVKESVEELGDMAIHPETGEPDSAHTYVIVSARNVFYDFQNKLKPSIPERARKRLLTQGHHTLMSAVQIMIEMQIAGNRNAREDIKKSHIN